MRQGASRLAGQNISAGVTAAATRRDGMYHKRQHDRVIATTPQETAGAWELCTHESIARVQLLPLLFIA